MAIVIFAYGWKASVPCRKIYFSFRPIYGAAAQFLELILPCWKLIHNLSSSRSGCQKLSLYDAKLTLFLQAAEKRGQQNIYTVKNPGIICPGFFDSESYP
jgi:hypothetical protein